MSSVPGCGTLPPTPLNLPSLLRLAGHPLGVHASHSPTPHNETIEARPFILYCTLPEGVVPTVLPSTVALYNAIGCMYWYCTLCTTVWAQDCANGRISTSVKPRDTYGGDPTPPPCLGLAWRIWTIVLRRWRLSCTWGSWAIESGVNAPMAAWSYLVCIVVSLADATGLGVHSAFSHFHAHALLNVVHSLLSGSHK